MAKQARSVRKLKPKHRAVKPRVVRPLDVARTDNHAARHEAKKAEAYAAARAEELGTETPLDPFPAVNVGE